MQMKKLVLEIGGGHNRYPQRGLIADKRAGYYARQGRIHHLLKEDLVRA